MSRFGDIAGQLVPDILCAFSQTGSDFVDFGNSVRDGLLGTNSDPDGSASGFENAIQRGLCGLGNPPERIDFNAPSEALPGQCNAAYRLRAIFTYNDRDNIPRVERFGDNDQNTYQGPLGQDSLFRSSGNVVAVEFANTNGRIQGPTVFITSTPTYELDLERVDGLPDNCSADGTPVDPNSAIAPSGTGDVTYENEDGSQVTEPYDFTFRPPFVSPSGDVIIPVEICLGPLCFEVCYNVNTGAVQTCGAEEPNNPCCPTVEDIAGGGSAEDPPPPESDERYAGVLVRIPDTSINKTATELGSAGPSLFIPRLAVVRFAVEIGGVRTWTVDQPVKTVSQGVFVNAPAFAYAYDVIPEPGITPVVTPIIAPASVVA